MERRKFTREFKLEAVQLIQERGVTVAQAARDLRVHGTVMRRWVQEVAGERSRSAFWAADKPVRPICPITITLPLHCTPEGVALIA